MQEEGNPQKKSNPRHVQHIEEAKVDDKDDSENELTLYHIGAKSNTPPLRVAVKLNEHTVEMELDTGISMLLMSETTFRQFWPQGNLMLSQCHLCLYSKEPILVWGSYEVVVSDKKQQATLPLIIVKGNGPTLSGGIGLITLCLTEKKFTQYDTLHCMPFWRSTKTCSKKD